MVGPTEAFKICRTGHGRDGEASAEPGAHIRTVNGKCSPGSVTTIAFNKTAFASWNTLKYGTRFNAQVSLADLVGGLIDKRVTCNERSLPAKTVQQAPVMNPTDELTYQGFYDFIQSQVANSEAIRPLIPK
ncbi:hypothetical protein ACVII0_000043 [Sinorhizobium meliloti]